MDNDKLLNQIEIDFPLPASDDKISSEPGLTPKPHISYAEFSEMRSKYYTLEDQYNKLKKDYELLVDTNERMKPTSENHHMILDIHHYCDKCLKFKPVVKKYIDVSEETIEYQNGFMEPMYDTIQNVKGNTVVSCEHHDTCSMMYDYIYEHLKKK